MLTWYQTMINSYQADPSAVRGEWMPTEEAQWEFTMTEGSEDQLDGDESDIFEGTFADREAVDGSIDSISLLGERNSGTRWIYA